MALTGQVDATGEYGEFAQNVFRHISLTSASVSRMTQSNAHTLRFNAGALLAVDDVLRRHDTRPGQRQPARKDAGTVRCHHRLGGAQGDRFRVDIVDHGVGVLEEDLPHLFDKFFRSDRSRSRQTGGAGLGLTLYQRTIKAHGGTIVGRLNHVSGMPFCFELSVAERDNSELE